MLFGDVCIHKEYDPRLAIRIDGGAGGKVPVDKETWRDDEQELERNAIGDGTTFFISPPASINLLSIADMSTTSFAADQSLSEIVDVVWKSAKIGISTLARMHACCDDVNA